MAADDLIGELDSYLSNCSEFSVTGGRSSGSSAGPMSRGVEPGTSPGLGPGPNPRTNLINMNPGSCPPILGTGSSQDQSINRQITSDSPSSHYAEKRKIDTDATDTSYGNNPTKIPKMEMKSERPETPINSSSLGRRAMSTENLNSVGNVIGMSGGSVKVELKPEMNPIMGMNSGPGGFNNTLTKPEESFLLENTPLTTEQGQQQTPVDPNLDKQKATTAARIRGALEASGLAGNLTPEDLQTLKRLNEIAKSTGLSQEQKSSEASQLLKNNPNVSRLLLKLRTEKSISSPRRPEQHGMSGPNMGPGGIPIGQVPSSSPYSPGIPVGERSTPGNSMPPSYNPNYGPNSNNYYPGGPGHGGPMPPGQWNGAPGSPGPGGYGYRGNMVHGPPGRDMLPNMTDIPHMGPGPMQRMHPEMGHNVGYPGNFNPMGVRGPGNMYHPMGPMDRMHPGPMNMGPARMGMGEPTRTMYMNRQTGMLVPDYPNPSMIGPRPPGYSPSNVPPPYISPGGFHPGHPSHQAHPSQMMPQRRIASALMNHHEGPGGSGGPYEMGSNPMHRGNSSMYPINHEYESNFGSGGNSFRDFRENLLTSKFPGNDHTQRQQSLPPQTESQLRARLSQPGIMSTASSSNSELANRLLQGKSSSVENTYDYNNINTVSNGNTQNNGQKTGTESLFDEIDNSQFNYLNPLDSTDEQRSQNYQFDTTSSTDNQTSDYWKGSSNTNELRSTLLRKLSTAIETSQNISTSEASKMANDIENKAFTSAETETAYMHSIAQHLAKIFSQSKANEDTPDSTTWQDQPGGAPNSSPDSSQSSATASSTTTITKSENSHFQTDTTLNCFQEIQDTTELNDLMSDPTCSPLPSSDSNFQTPNATTPQAQANHTNVIIQRGNRRLSGKTHNTHQPHSVDSGIGSPRSIPLYSPNPPITPKTSGSSPSVSISENSPEK